MQDPEKLREIEALGQEEGEDQDDDFWEEPEREPGWNGVPLLQAVICALALAALLVIKFTDAGRYEAIAGWYKEEMAQEIELPYLERPTPLPEPTPQPSPTPLPVGLDSAPLEMV